MRLNRMNRRKIAFVSVNFVTKDFLRRNALICL